MPSWNELLDQFDQVADPGRGGDPARANHWFNEKLTEALTNLSLRQGGRTVILYASGYLQKPQVSGLFLQIAPEDINGLMACIHGMSACAKGLTLVLHTPGGVTNAAETFVEYLHQKFPDIEVIIPAYAMSAGTMISLSCDRIFMGRQSQLGPIDPQMPVSGRFVSARAIVDQFDRAKSAILLDNREAIVWAPALQSVGPALLTEARQALEYGETMVARWLERRHCAGAPDAAENAKRIAKYFNQSENHKSHGRRIDREEAREQGLTVLDLEDRQDLQEAVLTVYHLATLLFEKSPCAKLMFTNLGKAWLKNVS